MKPKAKGLFRDVGAPICVRLWRGSGSPEGIAGTEHSHDFTERLLFHEGRGVHRVDERDYRVRAGSAFVVLGEQTHAVAEREDLACAEVHFHPGRLRLPTEQLRKLPGHHALFVLEPRRRRQRYVAHHLELGPTRLAEAMRHVERMRQEYERREVGYEAALVGRLIELTVFLSREYERSAAAEAEAFLRVGKVVSRLEEDYARPWRLDELCGMARMSKSALMVAFREATGQTPIEYLIHLRLRRGMHLLANTDLSITRIAFDTGFSDSNYFARKFRQVVGVSPSVYRRSAT